MKHLLYLIFCLSFATIVQSQDSIVGTIQHGNWEREYLLYVPNIYTGEEAVPLVFNFHGFTSNANEQYVYGDFRAIADTANFIIVLPQGTLLNNSPHFNVPGLTITSNTDDIGFTEALIDTLKAQYNIDEKRIYSTGMSNGGFMSYYLACQLNEKFAAIASVTGSMTPTVFTDCNASHPTPVMQIHGTADPTVPYDGNILWTKSVEDVIQYWVDFNNCDSNPMATDLPDLDDTDETSAQHFVYSNGDSGSSVELFKVNGGSHTWPGSAIFFAGTNYDFNATEEIWRFFSKYDIDGLIQPTAAKTLPEFKVVIAPNPTDGFLRITHTAPRTVDYVLYNAFGRAERAGSMTQQTELDLSQMATGVYFLRIGQNIERIIIAR